ncbi:MAG: 16S rRNA (cytidine(1402)-2'-O)-methyltransferase [Holosporales bacterium]|nr:16S rRNA (cytidine(1402)-2'-O)-methyltransferase [Holosporales bacterium]
MSNDCEALREQSSNIGNIATKHPPLSAGLYVVSTPIGNLEDITFRAVRVLQSCDRIICEDTRVSDKLLRHYGISKPLFAYHDRNADKVRPEILTWLQHNEAIALISDAGTPLIADPGFKLIKQCYEIGASVTTVPGATAFVSACVLSGFSTNCITFLGFAGNLSDKTLLSWKNVDTTLVLFEAPHKLVKTLHKLREIMIGRAVAIAREITKMYEEVTRGIFDEVIEHFAKHQPRGEFTIVLAPPFQLESSHQEILEELKKLLQTKSLKEAVAIVSDEFNCKKSDVYRMALELQ